MIKQIIYVTLISIMILGINACNEKNTLEPTEIDQITFTQLQAEILNKTCVDGCHSTQVPLGNLDLSEGNAYNNLINITSELDTNMSLILSYKSSESYIMFSMRGVSGSKLMPPLPLKAVSDENIKRIADWINRGAPND